MLSLLSALSFFVLGIVLVLLGVLQVEIARELQLDLAQFGFLGAVLALGFGVGLLAAGPLIDRLSRRVVFVGACALAGAACSRVDAGMGQGLLGGHLVALGLGGGACVTLLNAAMLDRHGLRAAPALAFMHAMATAGATSGPWLIGWAQGRVLAGWTGTFHALGALYLGLALLGLALPERAHAAEPSAASAAVVLPGARLQVAKLLALAAIGFAYVGVENGLTLFAVPWAESQGAPAALGRTAISAFWCALMAGRLLLALRKPAPSSRMLIACGSGGALVVCAAAWGGWSPVVALVLAGLALGPVYPLLIALTGLHFPRAGTPLGLVSGAGAGGGFALPWLAGALADALAVPHAIAGLGLCASLIAVGALALTAAARR